MTLYEEGSGLYLLAVLPIPSGPETWNWSDYSNRSTPYFHSYIPSVASTCSSRCCRRLKQPSTGNRSCRGLGGKWLIARQLRHSKNVRSKFNNTSHVWRAREKVLLMIFKIYVTFCLSCLLQLPPRPHWISFQKEGLSIAPGLVTRARPDNRLDILMADFAKCDLGVL